MWCHAQFCHPKVRQDVEQGHCAGVVEVALSVNSDYQRQPSVGNLRATASRGKSSTGCSRIHRRLILY